MINELQTKLYTRLRKSTGLSQDELGAAAGLTRRNVQAVENGHRLPTEEEEEALREASHATPIFVAELLCKALSELIGRRVMIRADDEIAYRATTPDGHMNELLLAAYELMPEDRWWAWRERESRRQALGQAYEQEGYANVRDLGAELEALRAAKEEAEEPDEG